MTTKECSLKMYNILQRVKSQLFLQKHFYHLTYTEQSVVNSSLSQYYAELEYLYRLSNFSK